MGRVIYSVAMSLDGFIAGRDGSYDWIPTDDTLDWSAFMDRFDTVLMGRHTYDVAAKEGLDSLKGKTVYVFSSSIVHDRVKGAILVTGDPLEAVRRLKTDARKDIWLMGGGKLFRSLLDAGLVDEIEVAVTPILLRQGIPFSPPADRLVRLVLKESRPYPSGIVVLRYTVGRED